METTWRHGRGNRHERARDGRKFDAAVCGGGGGGLGGKRVESLEKKERDSPTQREFVALFECFQAFRAARSRTLQFAV